MNTFLKFAGISMLLIGRLVVSAEIAAAIENPRQPTDFYAHSSLTLVTLPSDFEPSCTGKCSGPDSSRGSGTR